MKGEIIPTSDNDADRYVLNLEIQTDIYTYETSIELRKMYYCKCGTLHPAAVIYVKTINLQLQT